MKDKVYIKIKGLLQQSQALAKDTEDDNIEVISVGKYTKRAGKEYVKYEEVYDGESDKSINLIKFSDDCVEVTKKGAITTCLEFARNKRTMSCYNTPYGSINLGVFTSVLDIQREEDRIYIYLEYTMEVNDQQVNNSKVEIEITNQGKLELS